MARFIVSEERAIWVKDYWEVEAETAEDAKEAFREKGKYLGHDLNDDVDLVPDGGPPSVEPMPDGVPYVEYPAT